MKDILYNSRAMTLTEWLIDAVIALGAFGFGCIQLTMDVNLLFPDEGLRRMLGIQAIVPTAMAILYVAFTTIPVAFRRKFPWIVLVVTLVAWASMQSEMRGVSIAPIGPMIALFTVSVERPKAEVFVALALSVAVVLLAPAGAQQKTVAQLSVIQNVAFMIAVVLGGYAYQARQAYALAAEERAKAAEMTRESEAQRRVNEERVRIAREVHDITAHSLSAVSIQAAVAERLIDTDPAAAKEAIKTIRATSKTSLDDIRAMIGVLRTGDDRPESRPTEGTERMDDLVDYLTQAGLETALSMDGYHRDHVPAHVDVALYGIAREACTNIVRHAKASSVRIVLSSNDHTATLVVEDDGRGTTGQAKSGGHGIEGMRERVSLLGGTFDAGNRPQGGFMIRASVPLSGEKSSHG